MSSVRKGYASPTPSRWVRWRRKQRPGQFLARLALVLAVAAAVGWTAINHDQLDAAKLNDWIADLGMGTWAPVGFVALYALATVAFVPGVIFDLVGGALFGPFWGSIFNLVGATLGATLAFLVARYVAGDWLRRKARGQLERLISGVDAEGWRFVALVRLVPLFPFNLTNYALGLAGIPLRHYVPATIVFMAPATVAYTWLGHAGRSLLGGEAHAIWYGLLAFGLFAALALAAPLLRRIHRDAGTQPTDNGRQPTDKVLRP